MTGEGIHYETKPYQPAAKGKSARGVNGHTPGAPRKFHPEPWEEIKFVGGEEWAVKRFLPARGVAALYGKPGSYKSFLSMHIALSLALGREWAGRRVSQCPVVYVAAEGAGGLRKRKEGYARAWQDMPPKIPFYLISAAPNLGTEQSDVDQLAAGIEAAGIKPKLIVIDTLAQSLGTGDENGSGMIAFSSNVTALAKRFDALVLVVHHSGLSEDAQQRMRGHSSFLGALDALILCERDKAALGVTLTLQKLKDEAAHIVLTGRLGRIPIGHDEDGDEISTLIVEGIEDAERKSDDAKPARKRIPDSQHMLMTVLTRALDEAGISVRPFGASGPEVKAADDEDVRQRYYERIAEQAGPDEEPEKLAERQRKAFNRSVADAIKAERIFAAEVSGRRVLWFS